MSVRFSVQTGALTLDAERLQPMEMPQWSLLSPLGHKQFKKRIDFEADCHPFRVPLLYIDRERYRLMLVDIQQRNSAKRPPYPTKCLVAKILRTSIE